MTDRDAVARKKVVTSISRPTGEAAANRKNEWVSFLLLAFVGLPVLMVGSIAAYGFAVWFLQIMVFGPPT
jgi:nitrate reductase NapE